MEDNSKAQKNQGPQANIAYIVLGFGGGILLVLGVIGILVNPAQNTMTIFNIVLPVIATWVGTVLAFYFGQKNFEAASEQTRALVQHFSPEQVGNALVTALMRPIDQMDYFPIPEGKDDKDIKLADVNAKFSDKVARLAILDSEKAPKYMIHRSRIDNFNASPGKPKGTDTLDDFIAFERGKNHEYGATHGFVVVSSQTLVADAKKQMDQCENCQDIFITEMGTVNEPLIGWISDGKLSQYLES
jgi:hypothetical protein